MPDHCGCTAFCYGPRPGCVNQPPATPVLVQPLETMFESFEFDAWMDGDIWCNDDQLGVVLNNVLQPELEKFA